MPFRDWVSGEHPSALQFDQFLQQQVISIFLDDTERDDTVANEGMGDEDDIVDGGRATTTSDGISWVWVVTDPGPPIVGKWVELDRWKDWTSFMPTLTATTSNPTLGTGPVQFGRWCQEGSKAIVAYFFKFGSSGAAAGSGIYELSLPTELPAHPDWYGAEEVIAGNGIAIDSSTGIRRAVAVKIVAADKIRLEADGLTGPVTEANLIAWDNDDLVLSATIEYELEWDA